MVNELLINLVDSVLGVGKKTARGNRAYHCPYCSHPKQKLEINFSQNKKGYNPWHCWVCDKKSSRISTIFKKVGASAEKFQELKKIVGSEVEYKSKTKTEDVELPKEYQPIIGNKSIWAKHALKYLQSRNITTDDIEKYNIGFCERGLYSKMVIIPSYDALGNLNFFTGRSFQPDPYIKYKNPEFSRDIIAFELFINWDLPLILCEGPFDAIAIKRNVIPLLGKNIQQSLLKKIASSKVKKIYIALDNDAKKQALKFSEYFMNEGKQIYFLDLQEKDPSDLGFEGFTKLIQNATPLTEYKLMEEKLTLI